MISTIIAALSVGFLGSFHCIGMCGPIAMALPVGKTGKAGRIISVLIYNGGRIFTYALLGALFGIIGQTFAFAGFQQALSVVAGAVILLLLLIPLLFKNAAKASSGIFSYTVKVKNALGNLFSKEGKKSLFLIGLLNGLLPCGLVYVAIAAAVATGSIAHSALFMALFGAGTLPVMLAMPLLGQSISLSKRNTIRKAVPYIVGLMAVLLMLRGLNLGIPYVSPSFETNKVSGCCEHACCKK
ncbi:MAG: sulfite exporter TauE/SafE family protein [Bacteroidetes bacterium]|nr:sulfite exporter TauE/SafE family protein [Bacteroidota bacterium]